MKSRCSFILKAGLALVLCFILLFGTMSTGMAALVKDIAAAGAKADVAETGAGITSDGGLVIYADLSAVSWWRDANAKQYMHVWGTSGDTSVEGSVYTGSIWQFVVPEGIYENLQLYRGDWWNKTGDCTFSTGKNYISSFSENNSSLAWGEYAPVPTGGSMSLSSPGQFGNQNGADAEHPLVLMPNTTYTFSLSGMTAGDTGVSLQYANNSSYTEAAAPVNGNGTVSFTTPENADTNDHTFTAYLRSYKGSTYSTSYTMTLHYVMPCVSVSETKVKLDTETTKNVAFTSNYTTVSGAGATVTYSASSTTGAASVIANSSITSDSGNITISGVSAGKADIIVSATASGNTTSTKTIPVEVRAYEDSVVVYLGDTAYAGNNAWGTAYVVARDDKDREVTGTEFNQMTLIAHQGANSLNVYAFKFTKAQYDSISYMIFTKDAEFPDTNFSFQTANVTNKSVKGYWLTDDYESNKRTVSNWDLNLEKPITVSVNSDPGSPDVNEEATATAEVTGDTYGVLWSATSDITLEEDSDTTIDTDDAFTNDYTDSALTLQSIHAYAYPPTVSPITSYVASTAAADIIALKGTVNITANASTHQVTVRQKYTDTTYDSLTDGAQGTVSASYTNISNISDSSSISGSSSSFTALHKTEVNLNVPTSVTTGYEFAGWSLDGGETIAKLSGDYTISSIIADTTVTAIYAKKYEISAFKTYTLNSDLGTTTNIAAPPKKITITRQGTDVTTYTYTGGSGVNTPGGYYYNGNPITVLAGDRVKLEYTSLASSEAISSVWFDNNSTYVDPAATDSANFNPRYEMTAANSNLAYSDAKHTVSFTVGYGTTTANKEGYTDHSDPSDPVHDSYYNLSVGYNRLNITVNLGEKCRFTFKDKTGYTTESLNLGGYYASGESVSFTVAPDTASTKAVYSIVSPRLYKKSDNTEVTTGHGFTVSDPVAGVYTISIDSMPDYDVVIDLGVTYKYAVHFNTLIISDVVNGKSGNKIDKGILSDVTGLNHSNSNASIIEYKPSSAANNDGPYTTSNAGAYLVDPDDYATYSYTAGNLASGYRLIGWYNGDDSAPDYKRSISTDKTSIVVYPEKNTTVWLVVTADMYIYSDKKYLDDPSDTSGNWTTKLMTYNKDSGFYTYTFTEDDTAVIDQLATAGTGNKVEFKFSDTSPDTNFTSFNNITLGHYVGTDNNDYKGIEFGRNASGGSTDNAYMHSIDRSKGYDFPITIKFRKTSSSYTFLVEATPTKPHIYLSEGYHGIFSGDNGSGYNVSYQTSIDGGSTYVSSGNGDYKLTLIANSNFIAPYGDSYEGNVSDLLVNAACKVKISKPVSSDYQVSAFVLYNVTTRNVTSKTLANEEVTVSDNTYSVVLDMPASGDSYYVVPIIEMKETDKDAEGHIDLVTVKFDASQLNTTEWGDLVSCYAWYANDGGNANGGYPGQLMIPNADASEWTATFPIRNGSADDAEKLLGITFANYLDGAGNTVTWLGRTGVISAADTETISNIIPVYNEINRSNDSVHHKKNFKVQTYDYREPIAMIENPEGATKLELFFSIKNGNDKQGDVLSWKHSEMTASSSNVLTGVSHVDKNSVTQNETLDTSEFEYLTDSAGNPTDFYGGIVEGSPTPSFYIVAKGMVTYRSNSLKYVYCTDQTYEDVSSLSIDYDTAGKLDYASQWYIYDATGKYITNILSAAYCEHVSEADSTRRIVKLLDHDLGYSLEGKAVAICYDNPRYCDGDSGGVPCASGSFNCYRYVGQWYAKTDLTPVTYAVEVGFISNSGYVFAESHTASYGTASAMYNTTEMGATSVYADGDLAKTKTDTENHAYVTFLSKYAPYGPVTLTATAVDFDGWYTKNGSDSMELKSKSRTYVPENVSTNTTYYAMYVLTGKYVFKYPDRNGDMQTIRVSRILNDDEYRGYSGNNNQPGVPTFLWTAEAKENTDEEFDIKSPVVAAYDTFKNNISIYKSQLSWPDMSQDGSEAYDFTNISWNGKEQTVTFTASRADEQYTFNFFVNGTKITEKATTVDYNKNVTFNPIYNDNPNYCYIDYPIPTANVSEEEFSYWSSDAAGTKILTFQRNFGLRLTDDQGSKTFTAYAQYGKSTVDFDSIFGVGENWKPYIEDVVQSRVIDTEKNTDTVHADYTANFLHRDNSLILEMVPDVTYGIIIVRSPSVDSTTVDLDYMKNALGKLDDNHKNSAYIVDRDHAAFKFEYNDADHISNFNRALFSISASYANMQGKKLTALVYVKDSGGTHYAAEINNTVSVSAEP